MTASEAKQKVLAVYPDAKALYHNCGMGSSYWTVEAHGRELGRAYCGAMTETSVWINAASRLPAPKPVEPAPKEGEKELSALFEREKNSVLSNGHTAWEYRVAPGGDGALGDEWNDKPHRLIYDLLREIDLLKNPPAQVESGDGLPLEELIETTTYWEIQTRRSSGNYFKDEEFPRYGDEESARKDYALLEDDPAYFYRLVKVVQTNVRVTEVLHAAVTGE